MVFGITPLRHFYFLRVFVIQIWRAIHSCGRRCNFMLLSRLGFGRTSPIKLKTRLKPKNQFSARMMFQVVLVMRLARLGQPDGISPSRMAEMLEVDKAGQK